MKHLTLLMAQKLLLAAMCCIYLGFWEQNCIIYCIFRIEWASKDGGYLNYALFLVLFHISVLSGPQMIPVCCLSAPFAPYENITRLGIEHSSCALQKYSALPPKWGKYGNPTQTLIENKIQSLTPYNNQTGIRFAFGVGGCIQTGVHIRTGNRGTYPSKILWSLPKKTSPICSACTKLRLMSVFPPLWRNT